MNEKRFYVYEWYIVETGEIFYVGKGTGNRRHCIKTRNVYFKGIYYKYKCKSRIYKSELTNKEAIDLEILRIDELQPRCNFTRGGDGFKSGKDNPTYRISHKGELNQFYGRKHSEETKRKISEHRIGKGGLSGEKNPMFGSKRTSGELNPMYGKRGFEHHNSKMYEFTFDNKTEQLTAKQCEKRFGIAFLRLNSDSGILHYKKKDKSFIYEGLKLIRIK